MRSIINSYVIYYYLIIIFIHIAMYFLFLTFAERTEAVYNHNFVCGIIPDVMVFSEEWRRLFHDVILTAL